MEKNRGFEKGIAAARETMKCFWPDDMESDQQRKLPAPPVCKEPMGGKRIALGNDFRAVITQPDYLSVLETRRSCWKYLDEDITLAQLSFLLWSAQGVQKAHRVNTERPAPSGGARHPFETYVAVRRVAGLSQGLYHYLPLTHELECIDDLPAWDPDINQSLADQPHHAEASAVVYWTCVAYRAEWRYSVAAHRVMLMDVGHLCQNFYLSATACGLAACGLAAFDQKFCDAMLHIDGEEEYTTYAAVVGHRKEFRER